MLRVILSDQVPTFSRYLIMFYKDLVFEKNLLKYIVIKFNCQAHTVIPYFNRKRMSRIHKIRDLLLPDSQWSPEMIRFARID